MNERRADDRPPISGVLLVIIAFGILVVIGPLAFWIGGNLVGFLFIAAWLAYVGFLIARRSRY